MKKLSKCNSCENFYENLHLLSHLNKKLYCDRWTHLSTVAQKWIVRLKWWTKRNNVFLENDFDSRFCFTSDRLFRKCWWYHSDNECFEFRIKSSVNAEAQRQKTFKLIRKWFMNECRKKIWFKKTKMSKIIENFEKNSILIVRNSFCRENRRQYFRDSIKSIDRRFIKNFRHAMIDMNSFFRF